jgi:hypothetical protein
LPVVAAYGSEAEAVEEDVVALEKVEGDEYNMDGDALLTLSSNAFLSLLPGMSDDDDDDDDGKVDGFDVDERCP